MSIEHEAHEAADAVQAPEKKKGRGLAWSTLVLVLVGIGVAAAMIARASNDLAKARGTLELQVLTSRLGAAAIDAEYGQYEQALSIMSGVYDGIVNYGIEHGSLPENYATVLATRDDVVVALSRSDPAVTEQLVRLFFLLQLPVDTELDSRYIIPATDSGFGMTPPTRVPASPPIGRALPDVDADTLLPSRPDTLTSS